MGLRQREWAKRARLALVVLLGGKCVYCGSKRHLELDCIKPRGHGHHGAIDQSRRVSFYRKELRIGNLQVLCKSCNSKKGEL